MPKYVDQVINDEILDKLSLKNRYNFINTNLMPILSQEQFSHLKSVQRFCMRFEKKNNITHGPEEDVYDWIPAFGAEGYITRAHNFEMIDINYDYWGAVADFLRYLAIDMFDTQFAMGSGATVLAVNPIIEHHENVPERLEALKDLVTGKAPGCICITEPERGSDAVHQLTVCEEQEDGSFILNGEKVYNTNAPKSKWAVAYATAEQ
ncbi:MAG: acyl-CoA dehydrogenase family protein, partial [Promethearchaeota archaeon]